MTNRELLRAPPERLTLLGKQRRHVLAAGSAPVQCPACRTPVDAITATGLGVAGYTFDVRTPSYRCSRC